MVNMWVSTKKKLNNSLIFFQFLKKNDFLYFYFTNMKQLYSKEIHESLISSMYAATNQMIEVDVMELIEFLKNAEETKNINYNFYTEKLNIRTDMTITLSEGFPPFKLEFDLELNNTDSFYSHITLPLILLIQKLKKNQDDLFDIIKKKDLEIEEYVLEGGNITHKNIKTETFDKDNFLMNTLQPHTDLYDDNINLNEIYLSSLFEEFNKRLYDDDKYDEPNSKFINKEKKKEEPIVSTKKRSINCSTTVEITQTSINVKKKKISSILKNL